MKQEILFTSFDSILGEIFIAAASGGILRLAINSGLEDFKNELNGFGKLSIVRDNTVLTPVVQTLKQYLKGIPVGFKYKLSHHGSSFQKEVWDALLKIPYGKVVSYKTLAQMINMPNGARAVGNACGKNPIPIIIPCHRVIAADGGLGGYSGGLEIKKRLLELEGFLCS